MQKHKPNNRSLRSWSGVEKSSRSGRTAKVEAGGRVLADSCRGGWSRRRKERRATAFQPAPDPWVAGDD